MAAAKKLYRSDDAVMAGVCAGIAEYLDLDSVVVRILAVLLGISSLGLAAVAYVILALVLPKHVVVAPETIPCAPVAASGAPCSPQQPCAGVAGGKRRFSPVLSRVCLWAGVALLFFGATALIDAAVTNVHWYQLWPMVLVAAGLGLMVVPPRSASWMRHFSLGMALFAGGLLLLLMSTGILAWSTIPASFVRLWPGLLVVAGLEIIGRSLRNDLFLLAAALCVVGMCLLAATVFAHPGGVDALVVEGAISGPREFNVRPPVEGM